ncbi:MAG TPA: DUF4126 family protein [Solirubrobacteraceae bacterium]|nr:DUF4126 family protein [Solirubrobacteraceae bacterium]
MHLVFDIFQGIGIAAAVGIRPFLPTLAVGGLAAGDAQISFKHTDFAFLQSPGFLLGITVGAILLALAERRMAPERLDNGPVALVVAAISFALGALLFAGALSQDHYAAWPGVIAGIACAFVGIVATRPLFARVRARLDAAAASAVPMYAEGSALLLAILSVLLPPVGLLGLLGLLWLILADRRREGQKYAGLRILR